MKESRLREARRWAAFAMGVVAFGATACAQSATDGVSATATAEVCGDGLRVTTVVLNYPETVDGARMDTSTYLVTGRRVTEVYTSTAADGSERAGSGPYVVVLLDREVAVPAGMGGGMNRPGGPGMEGRRDGGQRPPQGGPEGQRPPQGGPEGQRPPQGQPQGQPQTQAPAGQGGGGVHQAGKLTGGSGHSRESHFNDTVELTQVGSIYTTQGTEIGPMTEPMTIRSERTLVADDFTQHDYVDAETGVSLPYNLFTPKHMEEGKVYPLVLFMHDASGAGKTNVRHAILQGNGATVWATDEWQTKHPCFVLAPQFGTVTMDDDFNFTPDLTACLNLLDSLVAALPVDVDRIYTTGQSMGCMMSYEFLYRRPEFFASALLIAGQWDPAKMAPLSKKNLFIISCTGDDRSSAGVAQAIPIWQANGGMVVEQEWPLVATPDERARLTERLLMRGGNIHFAHLQGGSHNLTWRLSYDFEPVREWLFAQRRPMTAAAISDLLRSADDPTVVVCAEQGDAHGAEPGGIQAVEKAVMKGALMARVEVKEADGQLCLQTGEPLSAAIDSLQQHILLLVDPESDALAADIEALATEKGCPEVFVLYGSKHGTSLAHIAHVDLDQASLADVETALADSPLAVCLTYSSDDNALLAEAIEAVKPHARLAFDTTRPGLCGSHGDQASRADHQQAWGALLDAGATLILTNQIKPLLNDLKKR